MLCKDHRIRSLAQLLLENITMKAHLAAPGCANESTARNLVGQSINLVWIRQLYLLDPYSARFQKVNHPVTLNRGDCGERLELPTSSV